MRGVWDRSYNACSMGQTSARGHAHLPSTSGGLPAYLFYLLRHLSMIVALCIWAFLGIPKQVKMKLTIRSAHRIIATWHAALEHPRWTRCNLRMAHRP
mmetsp:Transcript_56012/g.125054  ORF Transcript_56012/g.125054 Transcript_56012/m.125054 type:complete len:98 (+) Transcript_56012:1488-1781(+)